jgi:hypothetical protein
MPEGDLEQNCVLDGSSLRCKPPYRIFSQIPDGDFRTHLSRGVTCLPHGLIGCVAEAELRLTVLQSLE